MTRTQRWLLLASSGVMGATGGLYWWMEHMMEPVTEWAAINHPLQPWVLKAHILAAPILVFAIGLITADHILRHAGRPEMPGRKSGHTALWLLFPMVLSGYLIQTVTHEGWLATLAWIHPLSGLVYLLALATHRWVFLKGKRVRKRQEGEGEEGQEGKAPPEHRLTAWESEGNLRPAPTPHPGPSGPLSSASPPGNASRLPLSPASEGGPAPGGDRRRWPRR